MCRLDFCASGNLRCASSSEFRLNAINLCSCLTQLVLGLRQLLAERLIIRLCLLILRCQQLLLNPCGLHFGL